MFDAVEDKNFYNLKKSSIGGDCFTSHPEKERIRKMRVEQMTGSSNHQYGVKKTKKMIQSVKEANSKSVIIDNVKYVSIKEASDKLGIGQTTICYRLKSKNFTNYNYKQL